MKAAVLLLLGLAAGAGACPLGDVFSGTAGQPAGCMLCCPPRGERRPCRTHCASRLNKVVCPVLGMFLKAGLLVPGVKGKVNREDVEAALLGRGMPARIVKDALDHNFKGAVCPKCPVAVDPFDMNVIRDGETHGASPFGRPQEHFRSTGIRDTDVTSNGATVINAPYFDLGALNCRPTDGFWKEEDVKCFVNFWDRDPAEVCVDTPDDFRMFSNDVDDTKRPPGCLQCQSSRENPRCKSQLHDAILDMFRAFKSPVDGAIEHSEWRAMWIDLDFPTHSRAALPPRCSRTLRDFEVCAQAPTCCRAGAACLPMGKTQRCMSSKGLGGGGFGGLRDPERK
eukprot:TRINITY_DN945_c0_g4_i1.p1 TRINITY_DN945_c0_g4~~TRINITY_DN945_c0_g4_i1.p1  ORF type:complete len:339 (+),score=98.47 TRINITY_DN945_c0_g4_i1:55-1071(+)